MARVLCTPIKVLKRDVVMDIIEKFNEAFFVEKAMEANVELTDAFREKVRTETISEIKRTWYKGEASRIAKVNIKPIATMGIELYDTTTLLHQRIDEFDMFVTSAEFGCKKLDTQVLLGEDSVIIEFSSSGICYCDDSEVESKANLLSITGKDIVGDVEDSTLKFWRKSKAKDSSKSTIGDEFAFSKLSAECKNVMHTHTWIENGDLIFQILSVFYTEGAKGEEKSYIDFQINVYVDAWSQDEIEKTLSKKFGGFAPAAIMDIIGNENNQLIREDGEIGFVFNDTRDAELDEDGWPYMIGKKTVKISGKVVPVLVKKPVGLKAIEKEVDLIRKVNGNNVSYYTVEDILIFENGEPVNSEFLAAIQENKKVV